MLVPVRMTVRIADLHLTFATTIWRQSPHPSTMEYRSSFAALDANHPSCILSWRGMNLRWALLRFRKAGICVARFFNLSVFNVLGVALELDQSPKTPILLEEESHAARAGLVLRLRFGGKPHRLGCLPPHMPFRIQIQNLRWGYPIPWS